MKILLVTMQLGRGYGQGTERYVTTLGDCLARRGHEVAYLAGDPLGLHETTRPGQALTRAESEGITGTIYRHPTTGWMTVSGKVSGNKRGRGRESDGAIAEWLRVTRPDVLHMANPAHIGTGILDLARQLAIPVVVTTMDFWWVCPKATLLRPDAGVCDASPGWRECLRCISQAHPRRLTRALGSAPRVFMPAVLGLYYAKNLRRGLIGADMLGWPGRRQHLLDVLARADHVIFPSAATRNAMQQAIRADRATVIPYGLPPVWFQTRPAQSSAALEPAALTIGYAGALLPHKGAHVLLGAIRRLGWTQTRIRLAGASGDASYLSELRTAAASLNVEFTGALPTTDMPAFLRSLDVFILPSLWPENLPFSMLEAHAGGVPVIASRLAGVAEQIGDERLLFEPGSAEELGRALEGFRRAPAAARVGEVQTLEAMTDATLSVYERARSRCRPAGNQAQTFTA